jgi:multicomponent Na+:H+ antiporter subunit C
MIAEILAAADSFANHCSHYMSYYTAFTIAMIGLYGIVASRGAVKRLISLSLFQSAIVLFYVSLGFVKGGRPPILKSYTVEYLYHAPLPHVLMLTAIVVSIATLAVGLALVVRMRPV